MAAVTIDVNDVVGINATAFRVLSENLGNDATRVFINQFKHSRTRETAHSLRPRVTASEIADIIKQARAEAEAGRGRGDGDYTKEKRERPKESFEKVTAGIMRVQSVMDAVKREHPELSAGQCAAETFNRLASQKTGVL